MIVVDTNILAYLLIEGDQTQSAHALLARDADWRSEGSILVEFSNILTTYIRLGSLTTAQGESLLNEAERRVRGMINLPHSRALRVAAQFNISAYDARFVATAQSLGRRLVTEDAKLRASAADWTVSLAEAIA